MKKPNDSLFKEIPVPKCACGEPMYKDVKTITDYGNPIAWVCNRCNEISSIGDWSNRGK